MLSLLLAMLLLSPLTTVVGAAREPLPDTEGSLVLWMETNITSYPLVIRDPGETIRLRPDAHHNITIYALGYVQERIDLYSPSPSDTLSITLSPAELLIIDVFGSSTPDLSGAYVDIRGEEGRITTITSRTGKAYVYNIFEPGQRLRIHINPPISGMVLKSLLEAGMWEPSLRGPWMEYISYESMSTIYPEPLHTTPLEADRDVYILTSDPIQTRTVYLSQSPLLAGYVKTASGEPLEGAIVAVKPDRFGRYLHTVTDEDGYYEFVDMTKKGINRYGVIYRGLYFPTDSVYTTLDRDDFNITVPDFYEVTGVVTDINGRPIPNVRILSSDVDYLSITYTDEDGRYRLYLPVGKGSYILGFALGDVAFPNIILDESEISDGVEDLTLEAEMILIEGVVTDPDGFVEQPILRLQGRADVVNRYYYIDIPLGEDGGFSALVPKRIMIAGQYRDVYWRLETISYYYAGSLSTAEAYYAGDTDLGSFTISPAPTVEVSLDISTIGTPPDRPVDTYVFGAWYNETFFKISVETNATIFGFSLGRFIVDGGEGVFQLRLYSPYGLSSIVRVTIPKDIMSTSISVDDDGTPIPFNIVGENQTHFTVEFRVSGEALINIRSAEVIPEFSSIYLLLLIAVPTVLLIHLRRSRYSVEAA